MTIANDNSIEELLELIRLTRDDADLAEKAVQNKDAAQIRSFTEMLRARLEKTDAVALAQGRV